MKKILYYIKRFVIEFVCAILCRCSKCFGELDCIVDDYGGLNDGYGHYYCPKCSGIIKDDYKKQNKKQNKNMNDLIMRKVYTDELLSKRNKYIIFIGEKDKVEVISFNTRNNKVGI